VLGNFFLLGGAGECWVRGHIPDNSGKEEVWWLSPESIYGLTGQSLSGILWHEATRSINPPGWEGSPQQGLFPSSDWDSFLCRREKPVGLGVSRSSKTITIIILARYEPPYLPKKPILIFLAEKSSRSDRGSNLRRQHRLALNTKASPLSQIAIRPRLFYLLDYGFLPQNVSEVGGKKQQQKQLLRDPKVQIITVGHYCNLKMVVSRAQLLLMWSPCTTTYRFDGRFKHLASARRFQ
jgi:hypothetical protein